MPQLLVRNLDEDTIKRLKALAKRHGRSLQGQVKAILEENAALPMDEVSKLWSTGRWQIVQSALFHPWPGRPGSMRRGALHHVLMQDRSSATTPTARTASPDLPQIWNLGDVIDEVDLISPERGSGRSRIRLEPTA